MKKLILILNFLVVSSAFAQDLQLERISKTVQKYFVAKSPDQMSASCEDRVECKEYSEHVKTYTVRANLEVAWEGYTALKPNEAWIGKSVFQVGYRPGQKWYFYHDDKDIPQIALGDRIFLQLNLNKMMRIPVGFEITKFDSENKVFEFSYLNENKSHGFQQLEFIKDGDNTKIVHTSRFKSASKFRDEKLYPPIHENLCDAFHAPIIERLENASQSGNN